MNSKLKHLLLVAEHRELAPLIKFLKPISDRYFEGNIGAHRIGVYITGVGKNAVKKSLKFLANIDAEQVWNVGNVGAITPFPSSLIIRIGVVIGQNGAKSICVDGQRPITLVTVNSLQDKLKLNEQYPRAQVVDMEAFHWLETFPDIKIIKVVLDKQDEKLSSPVKGLIWSWRIRRNAKLLSNLLIQEFGGSLTR